jgi:pimeloyl-ACP methyl ester carboxylesterase
VPTVSVLEVSLEYQWWGPAADREHPPILLLHDALGSVRGWGAFPERLAQALQTRVYAYSRQGYGASEPLTEALPRDYLEREALDVLPALREALRLDDLVLLGHQEGASIALIHAGGAAMETRGVVASSPFIFADAPTLEGIAGIVARAGTPALQAQLVETTSEQDKTVWGWGSLWTSKAMKGWNIEDFVRGVTCPVLALRGQTEVLTSRAQGERLCDLCRTVDAGELLECGDDAPREQPEVLVEAARALYGRLR